MASDKIKHANWLMHSMAESVADMHLIEQSVYAAHGELSSEVEIALERATRDLGQGVDRVTGLLSRLDATRAEWRDRGIECRKVIASLEAVEERIRDRIKELLQSTQGGELVGNNHRWKGYETAGRLVVYDESKVHPKYWITRTEKHLDKEALKKDLLDGASIEGATIEKSYAFRSHVNKN